MITDILTKPVKIEIDGKDYELEFDNKAYAKLEMQIGKGLFQIYDSIVNKSLNLSEYHEVFVCALMKHNKTTQINAIKKYMEKNPSVVIKHLPAVSAAFLVPLMPPEILKKLENKESKKKH